LNSPWKVDTEILSQNWLRHLSGLSCIHARICIHTSIHTYVYINTHTHCFKILYFWSDAGGLASLGRQCFRTLLDRQTHTICGFGLGDWHVVLSFAECAVNLCAVPAMPPKCLLAPPGGGIWCVVDVVGVARLKWPMRCPANNNLAWLYKYEIWILLEKLIQKTSFGIEVRQWEGFKMLIWRCINA